MATRVFGTSIPAPSCKSTRDTTKPSLAWPFTTVSSRPEEWVATRLFEKPLRNRCGSRIIAFITITTSTKDTEPAGAETPTDPPRAPIDSWNRPDTYLRRTLLCEEKTKSLKKNKIKQTNPVLETTYAAAAVAMTMVFLQIWWLFDSPLSFSAPPWHLFTLLL